MPAVYPIAQWYFTDTPGRYDIDLGDSFLSAGTMSGFTVPDDLSLGYGGDRMRERVAALYRRDPAAVVVTHGSQEALYLIFRSLLRPGDEVLTFAPGWPVTWQLPELIGCRVGVLGQAPDGGPDLAALRARIGPRTRMVVLTSPGNPTGHRISRAEAAELGRLLDRIGAYLLIDEEYVDDLTTDSLLGCAERAISVSGVSKVDGLPGLRVGWLCGPSEVVAAVTGYRHWTTLSDSPLTGALAAQAIERRAATRQRYRAVTAAGLRVLAGWADEHRAEVDLRPPSGTPFAWLALRTGERALDLARRLLDRGRVLVMPGDCFGASGGLRVTFARPELELRAGLARLGEELTRTREEIR